MKKWCFIFIILGIFLGLHKEITLALPESAGLPSNDMRYEIQSVKAEGDSIVIIGWALSHHHNHGESGSTTTYPKYYLVLTNLHDSTDYQVIAAAYNDYSYDSKSSADKRNTRIDLTCTLFHNLGSPFPECFDMLTRSTPFVHPDTQKNFGKGQQGVESLLAYSRNQTNTQTNYYYRNIGFKFIIPLSQLDIKGSVCAPNTNTVNYSMHIRMELNPGQMFRTQNISIYKDAVQDITSVQDRLIIANLPSTVMVNVYEGRVRLKSGAGLPYSKILDTKPDDTKLPLSDAYIFEQGIYNVIYYDYYPNPPLYEYARIKELFDLYPYRVGYYGLYIKRTQINGNHRVIPGKVDEDIIGYAPATWVEPGDSKGQITYLSVISNECGESITEDHLLLNCKPVNPSPAVFGPKEGVLLQNSACKISGKEASSITLPSYPGMIKAGTGFSYNVNLVNNITASKQMIGSKDQWLADIDTATKTVEDAKKDINTTKSAESSARSTYEHAERNLKAVQDALNAMKQKPDIYSAADIAELERRIAAYEVDVAALYEIHKAASKEMENAQGLLVSAQNTLDMLQTAYIKWQADETVCKNWTVANNYKPDPYIYVSAEGNDHGNKISHLELVDSNCTSTDSLTATCHLEYAFPYVYIGRYDGAIDYYPRENYFNGGRSLYTDLGGKTGTIYNLDLDIVNISSMFKWRITYYCDYTIENYFPPIGSDSGGGLSVIEPSRYFFRPISLINPFPSREPGSNWLAFKDYDFTTKKGQPLYDKSNIMYEINLTSDIMKEIKQYNNDNSYIDNRLLNGQNYFIHSRFKHIFEVGEGL